jgi:AcrR family transcriptional regulator
MLVLFLVCWDDRRETKMPKLPNPLLEKAILKAALALLSRRGVPALTMRAVALAAGTTTPTLYQRFADRDAILQAICEDARQRLAKELERAPSLENACHRYLLFSQKHPHEYELLMRTGWHDAAASGYQGPVFLAAKALIRKQFPGKPAQQVSLLLQLWCLVHGAASLLIAAQHHGDGGEDIVKACDAACKTLLTRR